MKNVKSIVDKGDRLLVTFDQGREMMVSKNKDNAVRKKLEIECPNLYPTENKK